jgi:KDO2-lipid IV(A) lauroyltransferase
VLARSASVLQRDSRRMLARHLDRATGGRLEGRALQRGVSEAFSSYGRYWYELLHLPADVRAGRIEDHIHVVGFEHIQAGLDAGNGVIIALPHLGGWEYAGAWIAAQGIRPLAVAEPLEPPEVFDWFVAVRDSIGIDVVALGHAAAGVLASALRANRLVALVCDRDLTGDGVEVDFFGERTRVPGGPALLALRTGAVLVPVAVYFRPRGGHEAVIRPPIPAERAGRLRADVARVTQDLVVELEKLISAEPEQWHLLQPNWPSDRAVLQG